MSLYGDLPPPSTDPEAASATTPGGTASTPSTATTPVKAALPAGWSASVTRFKPMLNRKLAPPKPKPARPNIPSGFVIQAEPQLVNSVQAPTASTSSLPVQTIYSAAPTVPQPQATPTVDENSWLKARTAQVQRQDNDHSHAKRQTKRAPAKGQSVAKGQPAPISLDDDYDIARPNEFEEFQGLLVQERRDQAEEMEHQRRRGRPGNRRSSDSRSRSRSISRSRFRSRSYSRSISRSRSRSRSLPRSRSRSRSRRHSSRSPPSSPRRSSLKSSTQRNPRSRSRSPHSQKSRRSRSPMARRRSPSPRSKHPHRRSPSPARREHSSPRTTQFKSFAPPPSELSQPAPPAPSSAPVVWADSSGEEAFLRRAQLGKQRQMQAPSQNTALPFSIAHTGSNSRAPQGAATTGAPSSVILLTNMVGPGEVDDTLQEETAAECEKFGPVVRCLIYEVKNRTVPAEEAVRIFVKFGAAGSAERALRDLDGRFFGGRQVRGQFFDERRFDLLQLAP
ncbi:splicing factor 45 [Entomortierella parvispora]|uniref:Splicing factor 45 n=1 Tax=Entomortierella parvispora TaxID=205924 RepID=A0A9P3HKA8_9FUNG|nr:splicing factor 45 [Entomortierella parvispora]